MPFSDRRLRPRPATLLTTPELWSGLSPTPAYLPPAQLDHAALKTIFIPQGFLHLFEALDLWGSATQGEIWTSREIVSRDVSALASPANWPGVERVESRPPEPGVIRIPSATPRPFRVATTSGFRLLASESEANRLWKSQRRKLKAAFDQERSGRKRLDEARHSLRQCLYAGRLKAFVFNPITGIFGEIAHTHWGTEPSNATFDLREPGAVDQRPMPRLKPVPLRDKTRNLTLNGYALVRETELHTLLTHSPKPPSPTDNERSTGGRPKKYDEDAVIRELLQLANRPDGLPETKAELQRHLLEWCQTTFGDEPSLSTVKRWIDKWCPKAR